MRDWFSSPLLLATFISALAAITCCVAGIAALRRKKLLGLGVSSTLALLLFAVAGMFGAISIGTQGFRALTHEEIAARITTDPTGPQRFRARFSFPDGSEATFDLAGDELYVDAHILKWKSIANYLGLHTEYELDRVAGRYLRLAEEQTRPRTVFGLAPRRPVDLFDLRMKHPRLGPLVDAEYGSASYVLADQAAAFEVRVSTSGLLIREIDRTFQ
ncbi:MAG: hypothetical protein ACE5G2_05450 [Candidatus Krumholzibacteriia bacterium]